MGIILNSQNPADINKLKKNGQKLVLAGGSFDILHAGHIEFLKRAKDMGDILVVLLESDEKIKKLKGINRPINTQKDRATVLSNLPMVDYVFNIQGIQEDKNYEILVKTLQPDIIAVSGSDRVFSWERKMEKEGLFKVIKVMERTGNHSTTNLIKKINI